MQRDKPWHKKVSDMINGGCTPEEIASILKNTCLEEVLESIETYSKLTSWYDKTLFRCTTYFGHKDGPYNTEEEMLCTTLPIYTYDSLSEDEKSIYNNESPTFHSINLRQVKQYFLRNKSKDRYIVAMKYHTAQITRDMGFSLNAIAEIINVMSHASVSNLLYNYHKVKDHDIFIRDHYDECINNFIYPVTVKNTSMSNYSFQYEFKTIEKK